MQSVAVAPLAGAWIEIKVAKHDLLGYRVAPLAGAWIEISRQSQDKFWGYGRTPRGCVD